MTIIITQLLLLTYVKQKNSFISQFHQNDYMKAIVTITCLWLLTQTVVAQSADQPVLSKADYLKKSKNQSTAAWILVGGGAAMVSVGTIIGITDGAKALGSIPTPDPYACSSAWTQHPWLKERMMRRTIARLRSKGQAKARRNPSLN